MEQKNNDKILLHACCGVCSGYPISFLQESGYDVTVYFCNPNLDTEAEFNKRLEAQKIVCEKFNAKLIVEDYNHKEYLNCIKGLENEPEKGNRCDICFQLRLKKSAELAKKLNIKDFTSSLAISPHKDFKKITTIGENAANELSLNYLPLNFRKNDGVLKTNNISKELNIYRQNYCGCEFSKNYNQ